MTTAFQITEDDILVVLKQHFRIDADFDTAESMFNQLTAEDFSNLEAAALAGGTELDEQTDAAYDALAALLTARHWVSCIDLGAERHESIEAYALNQTALACPS